MNRRIMYNRASADPDGKPWSERKKYLWWDEEAEKVGRAGRAGLRAGQGPVLPRARTGPIGMEAIGGDEPFIMHPDGLRLAVRPRRHPGRAVPDAL